MRKTNKEVLSQWIIAFSVLLAAIILSGTRAVYAEDYFTPYTVSSPQAVDELFKADKGLIYTGISFDAVTRETVHKTGLIALPEDGYVFLRMVNDSDMHFYYNTNRNLEACYLNRSEGTYSEAKLEKGTYYVDISWWNEAAAGTNHYVYLYYLPVSKGIQANQKLSADNTYCTISLTSPDSKYVSYKYAEGDAKSLASETEINGNQLKITENGTYTIKAKWTSDTLWGWFPCYQTITVTGITAQSTAATAQDTGTEATAIDNTAQTDANQAVTTPSAARKANPMTVKTKKVTVSYKTLKKKKVTVKAKKAFTIKKAVGKVTYQKVSGSKKITVSKAGKITVRKKTKKGKYTIKIKVTAAGNNSYKSKSKTVALTVTVK